MTTQTATAEYSLVDVDHVHPHPRNVRRQVTGVDELADSIKSGGLHQPLVVAPADPSDDTAGYTLVMGHRRHAAITALGWSEVPCVIRYDLDTEARVLEAMLAENMSRSDLTVTEEGDAVQALMDLDVTPTKIAKAIGRTAKHVKDRAQIAGLTDKARQAVDDSQITITDALHLSKLDENHELAQKVESSIGTPNFRYTLEKALQEAEFHRKRAALVAELTEAGATITDGLAQPADDEVRVFLSSRPEDVTDPQVTVSVIEWGGWNTAPRATWVRIRPRAEEDPDGGTSFVETPDADAEDDEVLAAEEARREAEAAVRKEQMQADNRARADRETARTARHRWLHDLWRQGMPPAMPAAGTRDQFLQDLVTVRSNGYEMGPDVSRLSPIVAGPDERLSASDPALVPDGWNLDRLVFAAWWIHIGHDLDRGTLWEPERWDDSTVEYLERLALEYDYPLSELEERLIAEYKSSVDEDPAEDD